MLLLTEFHVEVDLVRKKDKRASKRYFVQILVTQDLTMKLHLSLRFWAMAIIVSTVCLAEAISHADTVSEPIKLWKGIAPGDKGDLGVEHDSTKPGPDGKPSDGIIRLANVSEPTITIYSPDKKKNTGAAVVVCPGGGYTILALDLEGSEVCKWLNSIGVTGILLKYRVPARPGQANYVAPLQDAQRALGLSRQLSSKYGIDPHKIGILGFSAGGHLSAVASNNFSTRTYPSVDSADTEVCRPDFTILIYPAYLTQNSDRAKLTPELAVTKETPPAFIAMTADDPVRVENAFVYALALKNVGVRAEVHTYPKGGHGYGLRPSKNLVSSWPLRAKEWMVSEGIIPR